jgi:hypothetical protein
MLPMSSGAGHWARQVPCGGGGWGGLVSRRTHAQTAWPHAGPCSSSAPGHADEAGGVGGLVSRRGGGPVLGAPAQPYAPCAPCASAPSTPPTGPARLLVRDQTQGPAKILPAMPREQIRARGPIERPGLVLNPLPTRPAHTHAEPHTQHAQHAQRTRSMHSTRTGGDVRGLHREVAPLDRALAVPRLGRPRAYARPAPAHGVGGGGCGLNVCC